MTTITQAITPYRAQKQPQEYDAGKAYLEFQRAERGIRPARIRTELADYTITAADQTVLANSPDPISFTLPRASGSFNLYLNILNVGAGLLTVVGTINASVDVTFAQYHGCILHCDGVVYWQIGGI